MRRFEFVDEKSSKFWEYEVTGANLVVRFGRIGTAGQEKVKNFTSSETAEKEAGKLVAQKTGKGYAEV